ncbi:MAG: PEP-CTERM sorting domain-containing protein [Planctomycetota bacterium]
MNRTLKHLFAFALLAAGCLVAGNVNADLINVTSSTDAVRIMDSAIPFDNQDSSTTAASAALDVIHGTGDFKSGGYRTGLNRNSSTTSIDLFWRTEAPFAASVNPDHLGQGGSEVFFTAMENAMYTAFGDSQFGGGNVNHLMAFQLEDLTTGQILAQGVDGSVEGNPISTSSGLTGSIIAGHDYKWTYEFETSKRDDFAMVRYRATGNGGLSFTAIPEPTTAGILGGLMGLTVLRRRR